MEQCGWHLPQDMTADSFVQWRSSHTKAPKTLNEYLICAKGFAKWLMEQGRIAINPLALVQKVETRGREVVPAAPMMILNLLHCCRWPAHNVLFI